MHHDSRHNNLFFILIRENIEAYFILPLQFWLLHYSISLFSNYPHTSVKLFQLEAEIACVNVLIDSDWSLSLITRVD